jgi:hypothetical protein
MYNLLDNQVVFGYVDVMRYEYEWDENKRISNFARHKVDFADADVL